MAIIDEPVRGNVPPPWFTALPGIERVRAFANGLLPLPPLLRLLGIRPAHVVPGAGTWTMPATGWLVSETGLALSTFVETVLTGIATTGLPPGVEILPSTMSISNFRPSRPQQGNLLARGRIVNASGLFISTELEIEDPQGRSLLRATGHSVIRAVEPSPPPPPAVLSPVDEPTYATPDPWQRPVSVAEVMNEELKREDGLTVLRRIAGQKSPFRNLHGHELLEVEEGRIIGTLPASEWFCRLSRHVAPGVLAAAGTTQMLFAGLSASRRGETLPIIDEYLRFHSLVVPDGALLRIEAQGRRGLRAGDVDLCDASFIIHDADKTVVATGFSTIVYIDSSKRRRRPRPEAKRVLATLLFVDIVGSTEHAERLGDARWRALLEEYRTQVRAEIARGEGVEVDTAGDGFFVRFDSPARALQCARAARDGVKHLGIEIRAGIHAGECELQGRHLAGMAVHIAARVQAAAAPGEILVSETVKALAIGSEARFADRGEHALKGVAEKWRLYALAD